MHVIRSSDLANSLWSFIFLVPSWLVAMQLGWSAMFASLGLIFLVQAYFLPIDTPYFLIQALVGLCEYSKKGVRDMKGHFQVKDCAWLSRWIWMDKSNYRLWFMTFANASIVTLYFFDNWWSQGVNRGCHMACADQFRVIQGCHATFKKTVLSIVLAFLYPNLPEHLLSSLALAIDLSPSSICSSPWQSSRGVLHHL